MPAAAAPMPASYVYRIRVGDVIDIKFPLSPELNDELTIAPDGRITTAYAENVPVVGRTSSEVAADLRTHYATVLREPRLAVSVKSFAPTRIFVAGEVAAPGEFLDDSQPLTLSQAIARAGGLKISASPDKVFVIRRGEGDKPMVYATRYGEVVRGNGEGDIRLAPYDVVYAPRTSIAEAFLYFNQYVQQFVPVSWGFSYLLNNQPTNTVTTR